MIKKIKNFLNEVWIETRKVQWLTPREVVRYTLLVIGITFALAVFLGVLDFTFSQLLIKLVTFIKYKLNF